MGHSELIHVGIVKAVAELINPSDTKGFGTTLDNEGGQADPPCYLITQLT